MLQLLFITDAQRRRIHSQNHDSNKPGRQVVTFLLLCNITMWIMFTFEVQKVKDSPVQVSLFLRGFVESIFKCSVCSHYSFTFSDFTPGQWFKEFVCLSAFSSDFIPQLFWWKFGKIPTKPNSWTESIDQKGKKHCTSNPILDQYLYYQPFWFLFL